MKMRFTNFLVLFSAFILLSSSYAFATIKGVTYPDNAHTANVTGWTINQGERYVAWGVTGVSVLVGVFIPGGWLASGLAKGAAGLTAKAVIGRLVGSGLVGALGFLGYRYGARPTGDQAFVANGFANICPFSPSEDGKGQSGFYKIIARQVVMPSYRDWTFNTNAPVTANIEVQEAGADARWTSIGTQPVSFTIATWAESRGGVHGYISNLKNNPATLKYVSNLNGEITIVLNASQAKGGIRWNDLLLAQGSTISGQNPCSAISEALKTQAGAAIAKAQNAGASAPPAGNAPGSGGSTPAPAAPALQQTSGQPIYPAYVYVPAPGGSVTVDVLRIRNSDDTPIVETDKFARTDASGRAKIFTFGGQKFYQYTVSVPLGGWKLGALYSNGAVYSGATFNCANPDGALSCQARTQGVLSKAVD